MNGKEKLELTNLRKRVLNQRDEIKSQVIQRRELQRALRYLMENPDKKCMFCQKADADMCDKCDPILVDRLR